MWCLLNVVVCKVTPMPLCCKLLHSLMYNIVHSVILQLELDFAFKGYKPKLFKTSESLKSCAVRFVGVHIAWKLFQGQGRLLISWNFRLILNVIFGLKHHCPIDLELSLIICCPDFCDAVKYVWGQQHYLVPLWYILCACVWICGASLNVILC